MDSKQAQQARKALAALREIEQPSQGEVAEMTRLRDALSDYESEQVAQMEEDYWRNYRAG